MPKIAEHSTVDPRITESTEERKIRIAMQREETQRAIDDGTLQTLPPLAERYADTLKEYGLSS